MYIDRVVTMWTVERVVRIPVDTPGDREAGQAKAIATYQRGLVAMRKAFDTTCWSHRGGQAELLMSLAWSNLNRTVPDVSEADHYARSALKILPNWHYVRDLLVPQISARKGKQ